MQDLLIGTRVSHPRDGEGIISKSILTVYEIFFQHGGKVELTKYNPDLKVLEQPDVEPRDGLTLDEVERAITYVLDKYQALSEVVELGDRWRGGTLVLKPKNPELQPKEIPIETFFHKIIMVRDRLRVLEQNINSHSKLDDLEKVHLQQYITRSYGSLTTFNVLFSQKEDYFKGAGK